MSDGTTSSKLDIILNRLATIAIIISACCLSFLVIQRFRSSSIPSAAPSLKVGDQLNIVDLPKAEPNKKIGLIVLQVGCHFCAESLPFYKSLVDKSGQSKSNLVFALPQSVAVAKAYLSDAGITTAAVRSIDMSRLHVSGTPSIIVLDAHGVVKNVWIGELSKQKQSEVEAVL